MLIFKKIPIIKEIKKNVCVLSFGFYSILVYANSGGVSRETNLRVQCPLVTLNGRESRGYAVRRPADRYNICVRKVV